MSGSVNSFAGHNLLAVRQRITRQLLAVGSQYPRLRGCHPFDYQKEQASPPTSGTGGPRHSDHTRTFTFRRPMSREPVLTTSDFSSEGA
jgi:hypothetical protein